MFLGREKIELTERDMELFRFLNEQKFMVASQIYSIFWPSSKLDAGTGRQRLNKLVDAGYIKIFAVQKDAKTTLKLFMLTEKGIDELRKLKLDHRFSELSSVNQVTVEHTLKLVNVRAIFRELGQKEWISERLIRKQSPNRKWYPDGALVFGKSKIAIELENSIREKTRYENRFKHYEEDQEYRFVFFILSWPVVKSWIFDLTAPGVKILFGMYVDLLQDKGQAKIENKISSVELKNFFQ